MANKKVIKKKNPGDPPGAAFRAPSFNPSSPKQNRFATERNYNYRDAQGRGAEGGALSKEMNAKRKEFGKMYQSGQIKSKQELRDSVETTVRPGTPKKDIKYLSKNASGKNTSAAVKRNIKATGRKVKTAMTKKPNCSPKGGSGSCKAGENKTLGGKF
jgi:hypothetical protein